MVAKKKFLFNLLLWLKIPAPFISKSQGNPFKIHIVNYDKAYFLFNLSTQNVSKIYNVFLLVFTRGGFVLLVAI